MAVREWDPSEGGREDEVWRAGHRVGRAAFFLERQAPAVFVAVPEVLVGLPLH